MMKEEAFSNSQFADKVLLPLLIALALSLGTMRPAFSVAGYGLPFTDIIFVAAFAAWAAFAAFGKVRIRRSRFLIPLALYTAAMFAAAIFSEHPQHSLIKFAGVLYLSLLAFFVSQIVTSERSLQRVVTAYLIGAAIAAVIGVATIALFYIDRDNPWHSLFLHHYGSLPPGNYPRIQSTFFYPAMLCNFLTVATVMLFGARAKHWIGRRLFTMLLASFVTAAAFTVTPGLGGMLLGIAVCLGIGLTRRRAAILLAAGIFAAAAFTAVAAFTIFEHPTAPYAVDIAGVRVYPTQRVLAWHDAAANFAEHPLVGKGTGSATAEVYFTPPSGETQIITDAHNSFLNIAAQAGIVGFAAFILLCIFTLRTAFAAGRSSFALWLGIAFASAFLVQGLVGSFEDARHLWLLIGLIPAAAAIRHNDR